ncbi:hypothetical protein [Chryseobacterium daeguense]|uniref:hypothetical protein n=1 Tax=Chryseobacterium daeguense TaxID=412438 RepID=UPI00041B83D2|nr:hypothetical protein [Chryseobacterium daeguense]
MKKFTFQFRKWALLILFFAAVSINAQKSTQNYRLGSNAEFLNQLQTQLKATADDSKKASLLLYAPDQKAFTSYVNFQKKANGILHLEGEVEGAPAGTFSIKVSENKLDGNILFPQSKKAYIYYSDHNGTAFIKEIDINKIVCVDFHASTNSSTISAAAKNADSQKSTGPVNVFSLESFPGAAGCLLLDFNGHTLPAGSGWNAGNPIVALPSGMTDANILEAWEIVSEDFRPFNLNITTDENVFNSYPLNKRRRCIITPTDVASPNGTGIALINSFSSVSDAPLLGIYTFSRNLWKNRR